MTSLRELEKAAIRAPWGYTDDWVTANGGPVALMPTDADAEFVAAARNAMPLLLDVVEAAWAVVRAKVYEQPHTPRSEGGTGFISVELVNALAGLSRSLDTFGKKTPGSPTDE